MIANCANPECHAEFKPGKGRFYRFEKKGQRERFLCNSHEVQHYWLCGGCSAKYMLDLGPQKGLVLVPRLHKPFGEATSSEAASA